MKRRKAAADVFKEQYAAPQQQMAEEAEEMEMDHSLYRPTEKLQIISDYVPLARKAYEAEKISVGKFEELLYKLGLTIEKLYSDEQIKQDMEKYGDV